MSDIVKRDDEAGLGEELEFAEKKFKLGHRFEVRFKAWFVPTAYRYQQIVDELITLAHKHHFKVVQWQDPVTGERVWQFYRMSERVPPPGARRTL